MGSDLRVTGLVPSYGAEDSPCDLICQYERFATQLVAGQQSTGMQSPEVCFANAETDEMLKAFVRRFGPVVARSVKDTNLVPDEDLREPKYRGGMIAHQDMQELKNEQMIYRAALTLVMRLDQPGYDYVSTQQLVKTIAANTQDWPRQWEREKSLRNIEPQWKLSPTSLKRIEGLSSGRPDALFLPQIDSRIVICELLNSLPSTVFPNPLELHSSIKYGIRPLLYSLLRRQFIAPRGLAICANTECRNFFNIGRSKQQFCSQVCSLRHRQRLY